MKTWLTKDSSSRSRILSPKSDIVSLELHAGPLLAHILAPKGTDSIQTAVLAIKHGLTATDLGETIFPCLTTVEGLKLAAQAFDKDAAKLSCCVG